MGQHIDFKSNMTFVKNIQPLINEKQPVQGAADLLAASHELFLDAILNNKSKENYRLVHTC